MQFNHNSGNCKQLWTTITNKMHTHIMWMDMPYAITVQISPV